MTQKQAVYDYMVKHGGITSAEAFTACGVTRLSARIWDLRNDGIKICNERIKAKNRYGKTIAYDRYRVVKEDV
jgi:hypothetical protein